jgi:segregation and condensation protein B
VTEELTTGEMKQAAEAKKADALAEHSSANDHDVEQAPQGALHAEGLAVAAESVEAAPVDAAPIADAGEDVVADAETALVDGTPAPADEPGEETPAEGLDEDGLPITAESVEMAPAGAATMPEAGGDALAEAPAGDESATPAVPQAPPEALNADGLPITAESVETTPSEAPAIDEAGEDVAQAAAQTHAEEELLITAESVETDRARLKAVIEAVIYITDEPLSSQQIAGALSAPIEEIKAILDELTSDYAKPDRGLSIREVAGGYKMATKPEHHEEIRAFVKNLKPPLKLSLAALETLAVIAYKQPITAPEIMEIRGVQGAGVLKTLLDRRLIATAGRKNVIGKPILYKTTREFLVQFGLKDLAELPTLREFEELGRLALSDAEADPSAQHPVEEPDREPTPPADDPAPGEPPHQDPPAESPPIEEPPPTPDEPNA